MVMNTILRWGYTPTYTGFSGSENGDPSNKSGTQKGATERSSWDPWGLLWGCWDPDSAQADLVTVGQQEFQALAILKHPKKQMILLKKRH